MFDFCSNDNKNQNLDLLTSSKVSHFATQLTTDQIRACITPICQKHGVKAAYLFGSYARGTANETSDIDLRIVSGKVSSLTKLASFHEDLSCALQKKIDIITQIPQDEWSAIFRKNVTDEEILLYADK